MTWIYGLNKFDLFLDYTKNSFSKHIRCCKNYFSDVRFIIMKVKYSYDCYKHMWNNLSFLSHVLRRKLRAIRKYPDWNYDYR